jgi:hypothetical protein
MAKLVWKFTRKDPYLPQSSLFKQHVWQKGPFKIKLEQADASYFVALSCHDILITRWKGRNWRILVRDMKRLDPQDVLSPMARLIEGRLNETADALKAFLTLREQLLFRQGDPRARQDTEIARAHVLAFEDLHKNITLEWSRAPFKRLVEPQAGLE